MKYVNYALLAFAVLAVAGALLDWPPVLVFFLSALGVVPMAGFMGKATEELAIYTGPKLGGLLNATLGNSAELIIAIIAIREGLLTLVLASITGSILGNILLILGLSVLLGGLRFGEQKFDRTQAGVNATMLILAVIALAIPSFFNVRIAEENQDFVEYLSLSTAVVMMIIYALSIIFSFRITSTQHELAEAHGHEPAWSRNRSIGVLIAATLGIVVLSEVLIGAVEPVVEELGISEFFLGIILIPLVGNVAEHLVAVQVAMKNKMELSLAISIGSSLQIALFVTPVLVFVSLLLGNPLQLTFDQFEIVAMIGASLIAALIALDGKSNWLEGAQLLGVYVIIALAFFFLPS
ncbi:MAG: calcium/proton exchanger [Chloroflexota bacterium]|nr:MAG: calcium/proton exchanger [Chloroflexota bacterium]